MDTTQGIDYCDWCGDDIDEANNVWVWNPHLECDQLCFLCNDCADKAE